MTSTSDTQPRPGLFVGAFLVVSAAGIGAVLFFFQRMAGGTLGAVGIGFAAITAAIASVFNPCALPALPGFLAVHGRGPREARGRTRLSAATAAGAMICAAAFGVLASVLGQGVKEAAGPFKWVQAGAGVALIALAIVQLAGGGDKLPAVAAVTSAGSRLWDRTSGTPSTARAFLFGGGYVAVGAG